VPNFVCSCLPRLGPAHLRCGQQVCEQGTNVQQTEFKTMIYAQLLKNCCVCAFSGQVQFFDLQGGMLNKFDYGGYQTMQLKNA
jgi:hypothetical protein